MNPLRVSDVARILDCNPATVYRMVRAGTLPHYLVGKAGLRFVPEAIDAYRGVQYAHAIPRVAEGQMPPQQRRLEKLVVRVVRGEQAAPAQVNRLGRRAKADEEASAAAAPRRARRRGFNIDQYHGKGVRKEGVVAAPDEKMLEHAEEC